LYLGGHPTHNFTFLPHDLPVHRGFAGCLFDFSLRSYISGTVIPLDAFSSSSSHAIGRNVGQCGLDICARNPCRNGGTCVSYGSSYM
jgi:EYS protein